METLTHEVGLLLTAVTSDLVDGSKGSGAEDPELLELRLLQDAHLGLVGRGPTRCQRLHQLRSEDKRKSRKPLSDDLITGPSPGCLVLVHGEITWS